MDNLILKVPKQLFQDQFKVKTPDDILMTRRAQGGKLQKIMDVYRDDLGRPIIDSEGRQKLKVEYPEKGGVLVYHVGFPYPEKGLRDDYVMQSVQIVKRALVSQVRFFTQKRLIPFYLVLLPIWKKVLNQWVDEFLDYAHLVDGLQHYILEDKFYTDRGRELLKGFAVFFREIGINRCHELALVVVSCIDFDRAYDWRLGDIFGETTTEALLKYRGKEIARLFKIFAEREDREHLVAKFDTFAILIRYTLWIPLVKRAFRQAIEVMDFQYLPLDEADRYHVRHWGSYKWFGMTDEERLEKWPLEQHWYI